MTEKPTVSHEQIGAQITALDKRIAAHEKHMNTITGKLFEKADEATAAAHANSLQIAGLQSSMNSILNGRDGHLERLSKVEGTVSALQKSDNLREGERSVLSALMRSPLIGWLAAAGAVLWGTVKNVSAHVPMVMFALLVTASLAGAALAKPVTVVSVHDGDTLAVKGQWVVMDGRKVLFRIPGAVNVRLLGIDTPEMGARAKCQAERDRADRARDSLRVLAQGKADIGPASHDKYGGRLLADIRVNGVSLSAAQIAGGHAVAYAGEGLKKDWCT